MDEIYFIDDWPMGFKIDSWVLDAAYGVFAFYAKDGIGRYQDFIRPDLQAVGVMVKGDVGIKKLAGALSDCLNYEERERRFYFSFPQEEKKNKWPAIAAVFAAIFISILVMLMFSRRQAADDGQPKAASSVLSAKLKPDTVPARTIKNRALDGKKAQAFIDSLMALNLFAQVKDGLNNQNFLPDGEKKRKSWTRLYERVPIVSDSLEKIIKSAVKTKGYQEALSLELRFDKEVFQLAGSSYRLRSELVDNWVYSYKDKCSKSKAIDSVTAYLKEVYNNCAYSVGKDKNGKYFPKYDPDSCK
jgi:hypothetical protein